MKARRSIDGGPMTDADKIEARAFIADAKRTGMAPELVWVRLFRMWLRHQNRHGEKNGQRDL